MRHSVTLGRSFFKLWLHHWQMEGLYGIHSVIDAVPFRTDSVWVIPDYQI